MLKSDFYYDLPEELIAQTPVEPRNSSRLLKMNRETGELEHRHFYNLCDYLKKGDLLAELDPSLFQSNVDQSTAKLNNAKATLSRATASLNYKKNNYQRYKNLYAKNYVSKDEVELAYSNYQQALAEVSSASAEVNAAQATLNNNMTNLGYSKITSPVDGTVISRAVDVGQTVAASFNTPTLFEVAKDLTQMQIETSVSEADIGKIKVGQVAKYTLDGYQDKTFEGKVTQVEDEIAENE